jgi:RNA polymerase sigma factor (sigma-70 family)
MSRRQAEFETFFRSFYQRLLSAVIFAGGELHEAEDALESAMIEAFVKWDSITYPQAYVRVAAIHNLIKEKERTRKEVPTLPDDDGAAPNHVTGQEIWEQEEWVISVLASLPPAQREILACMVDEFRPYEIALLLGRTPVAVRQNLCAARKRLKKYLAENNGAELPQRHTGRRPDER